MTAENRRFKEKCRELAVEIVDVVYASQPNGRPQWAKEEKNLEPVYANVAAMVEASFFLPGEYPQSNEEA